MLFLSEQEMWQSVTLEDVMDAIEDAYAAVIISYIFIAL